MTMGSNDEAQAAIDGLDQRHTWEGMDAPMVGDLGGWGRGKGRGWAGDLMEGNEMARRRLGEVVNSC